MNTIQNCQKAIRVLKAKLNKLLDESGTYKTTSSWSAVKYVELEYNMVKMYDEDGNPGIFTKDYDEDKVRRIVDEVREQFGISDGECHIEMKDSSIKIEFFSSDER